MIRLSAKTASREAGMKLDEVKKGTIYGVRSSRGRDPRQVEALGIVKVDQPRWDNNLEKYVPRQVRHVQVKFLDKAPDRWEHAKGAKVAIDVKEIVAEWKELGPQLRKRVEEQAAKEKLQDELEKRMKKLLGRNYEGYVSVSGIDRARLDLNGKYFIRMLELAEAGKRG